jgi:hypothetical protein
VIGISAPGGARIRLGAESAENKKPGYERRAHPSISWAALQWRPLGRKSSKLDSFYPVFVINLTSTANEENGERKPGPSEDDLTNQESTDIKTV